MSTAKLSVLKFGGSSLATPEQIRAVAKKISERHRAGENLIVVTSAMGKTTDQLTELAYKVSPNPLRRELDMLLSTGERVSMALMAMALNDLDCPAISFTGSQAGIMTDSSFSNAQIVEIKPIRVAEELQKNKVVVLAGFQGVDPISKEVTTLGRGGSDTTAVAMAAHFKAQRCEFLKDVAGVYSCDPKVSANAQLYPTLSINALYEFCFWGAKVLNSRAALYARKHHVPLFIGKSDDFSIGTEVSFHSDHAAESASASAATPSAATTSSGKKIMGINSHKCALELTVACTDTAEGFSTLDQVLYNRGLPSQQLLQQKHERGVLTVLLSIDADAEGEIIQALNYSSKIQILRKNISTVTCTYFNFETAKYVSETEIVPNAERENRIRFFSEKM